MRLINPSYYAGKRGYQHFQMVLDFKLDYFLGVAAKYLVRCGKKNPREEDLTKARWYLLRFMLEVEELPEAKPEVSPQEVCEWLGVDGSERLALIHILYRRYADALLEIHRAIDERPRSKGHRR